MLATLGGPPPMQQVGLADSDPIEALWAKLQEKMKLPEDREACDKISDHCISEWAMVTVSCLKNPALLQQDVLDILAIANKPKWLRTLEFLLDHRYPVLGAGVPPSAALAQSGGEVVTCPTKVERFPAEGLGALLQRTGQLEQLFIPAARLRAVVTESVNPDEGPLTYNDTKAVMCELFVWLASLGDVKGCATLARHLSPQLYALFPQPHGNTTWAKKLMLRKKNGRRASAKVCAFSLPRPARELTPAACAHRPCTSTSLWHFSPRRRRSWSMEGSSSLSAKRLQTGRTTWVRTTTALNLMVLMVRLAGLALGMWTPRHPMRPSWGGAHPPRPTPRPPRSPRTQRHPTATAHRAAAASPPRRRRRRRLPERRP